MQVDLLPVYEKEPAGGEEVTPSIDPIEKLAPLPFAGYTS
jgi:hypothetical protein